MWRTMNGLGTLKGLQQIKTLNLIMCNRRRSLHNIASQIGINSGPVQSILANSLGMSKVSARWVPEC